MAIIEHVHPAKDEVLAYTETIEVRIWALSGSQNMPLYIGSGVNFRANETQWVEMMYCVEGAQVFYTRSFLNECSDAEGIAALRARLDELENGGEGDFWLVGMFPETSIKFSVEKSKSEFPEGEVHEYTHCELEFFADTGVVFGMSGPGNHSIVFQLHSIDLEEAVRFLRELLNELEAVQQGRHPDPAAFREGSSEWPFVWQLNQPAYDRVAVDYDEDYFENPLLVEAFNSWVERLPAGAQVLDAGCGHGQPVIAKLLEHGFQVTGSDFSPAMLRRAREQFPGVPFVQQPTTLIRDEGCYDGICSFNSLLYQDPIDLLNSIRRLNRALKPGGLLFLFAYDSGPDWRGEPFGFTVRQWMWKWHYGMEEAASLLEEHGYFKVLETGKVITDPEEAERIAREQEEDRLKEEEFYREHAEDTSQFRLPYFKALIERSPYAYIITAQRREK